MKAGQSCRTALKGGLERAGAYRAEIGDQHLGLRGLENSWGSSLEIGELGMGVRRPGAST